MLERDLERKLIKAVEKTGGQCWKFTSPGTVGVPDRICILPGGKVVFVEMKQEFGRLANIQKYRLKQLAELGCDARVVKGERQLKEFLKELEVAL